MCLCVCIAFPFVFFLPTKTLSIFASKYDPTLSSSVYGNLRTTLVVANFLTPHVYPIPLKMCFSSHCSINLALIRPSIALLVSKETFRHWTSL